MTRIAVLALASSLALLGLLGCAEEPAPEPDVEATSSELSRGCISSLKLDQVDSKTSQILRRLDAGTARLCAE